jgi:SAM-dependent methyltransferase
VSESIHGLHREWLDEHPSSEPTVLDLGCFKGNALSFELAERARRYVGIDLSESAIAYLQDRLRERNLEGAEARKMDFLENDFPAGSFDIVYAYSVLHHFRYLNVALDELRRVLAPGGIVITIDPLNTSYSTRLARALYRPLQSDKEWEFPFDRQSFHDIDSRFRVKRLQGLTGCAKYPLPLMLIPVLCHVGERLSSLGARLDARYATREGFMLWRCMQVTMLLENPGDGLLYPAG